VGLPRLPGAFPVKVVEAMPPCRIVIEWDGEHTAGESGTTRTTFEPIDDGARTLVAITERAWRATRAAWRRHSAIVGAGPGCSRQ